MIKTLTKHIALIFLFSLLTLTFLTGCGGCFSCGNCIGCEEGCAGFNNSCMGCTVYVEREGSYYDEKGEFVGLNLNCMSLCGAFDCERYSDGEVRIDCLGNNCISCGGK